MKIRVVAVGKLRKDYIVDGVNDYLKRISHYIDIEIVEIPEGSEKKYLLKKNFNVALDRSGKAMTSLEFSKFIEGMMLKIPKDIAFFIGGAEGFSSDFLKQFDMMISLSSFTFPHEIVRLVLMEQIYRACTIIKGEKYHR